MASFRSLFAGMTGPDLKRYADTFVRTFTASPPEDQEAMKTEALALREELARRARGEGGGDGSGVRHPDGPPSSPGNGSVALSDER